LRSRCFGGLFALDRERGKEVVELEVELAGSVSIGAFGSPDTVTNQVLCIYDSSGRVERARVR
jgi:hypothetical protein